jgi:alpha-L-rhamnosidase
MKYFIALLSIVGLFTPSHGYGQTTDSLRANTPWHAQWIGLNNQYDDGRGYGVYYFRKSISMDTKPAKFIIHVSADNHYKLFVNGQMVSDGPARGDLFNYNYETVNIAPYLKAGNNSIAALVWNEAQYRPEYQVTFRTSFIVQGNTAAEEIINTDKTWKCVQDEGYKPVFGYFVSINGQSLDMNKTVSNWWSPTLDDSKWPAAAALFPGQPKGLSDGFGYMLVPSLIAAREMTYQPITVVRKAAGIQLPATLHLPLTIPANTKAVVLLDQTYETNAYATIKFNGGKGAGVSLGYAEALFEKGGGSPRKGNRNDVEGKEFRGLTDTIISNGGAGQSYTSFLFRTYRFMRLTVQTANDPLVIDSLYGTFTAYPFKQEALFKSDNAEIKQILDIGWHTARLDAVDAYFTGQYYERLQYIGDARIQALISYYYSSDDRFNRNALDLMDRSRLSNGITLSRYPTVSAQVISTFSLLYIGMLHDYWMYRNDSKFVAEKLRGAEDILKLFGKYQQADGSLKNTPYWTYVDWAGGKGWDFGSPPKGADGSSSIIDLQLLWAYQWAAAMEAKIGTPSTAYLYQAKAAQLKQVIRQKYWDPTKMLYADTKEKNTFSQHANALALLTEVVTNADKLAFSKRLIADTSLTKCTIYFNYYLNQALIKGGLGNNYMDWLGAWRDNIRMGLTTWAEESNLVTTRSDCHAWGSSPNIEFFRSVLGIDSYAPGFTQVMVEPHLGKLTKASGEIPHPNGKIALSYELTNGKWKINISLPKTTTGIFIWKGTKYPLKANRNSFVI